VGSAAGGIVAAGLAQAQLPVDRKPNIFSIFIVLAVVLPPANRAQAKRAGNLERLVPTAWTAKAILSGQPVRLAEPREEQITLPTLEESEHQDFYRRCFTT
jgi:hypothetical protein